jgi:hypothetical protein
LNLQKGKPLILKQMQTLLTSLQKLNAPEKRMDRIAQVALIITSILYSTIVMGIGV